MVIWPKYGYITMWPHANMAFRVADTGVRNPIDISVNFDITDEPKQDLGYYI